jgi:hypothetical protein
MSAIPATRFGYSGFCASGFPADYADAVTSL